MSVDPSVLAALFPQATPAPQGVSVLLIAIPPELPPKIQGEVISVDKSGQVVIQTEQGEVVIKTELALRVSQNVEIRLPPPQINAPPIATLIANIPVRPEVSVVQTLPPPVLLDLAAQTEAAHGMPLQIAPTLPGYAAPASIPAANTLFQLVGQDIPATLLTQNTGVKPAPLGATPNPIFTQTIPGTAIFAKADGIAQPVIDRVQILFLGSIENARAELESFVKVPQNEPLNATQKSSNTVLQPLSSNTSQAPSPAETISINTVFGTTPLHNIAPSTLSSNTAPVRVPLLAQLIGLTPQKLPVFEAISMPGNSRQTIPQGAQIILHTPVLMTPAEERSAPQMSAALLVRMPPASLSPEQIFALQTLPEELPLLNQMLQDPTSLVPPAMAAHVREIIPRPNSPQFATQIIMTLLGLSKGDPAQLFGAKMMEVLKPEQHAQLQKEIQLLPTLMREGAQVPDGIKYNFPVEMAGQFHMWQLTLRPPDYDGRERSAESLSEKPTRFILDFTMSHIGSMQVDGISFARSRRLDLILRTPETLQDSVKNELIVQSMSVFEKADLKGSIEFQKL